MLYSSERRPGVVIVLIALCLTAMIGIVAIALDGGLLLDDRRRQQSAADAAALAAAADLYANFPTNGGLDPGGTAQASAKSVASLNGYGSGVTVNIPPIQSDAAFRKAGYAEVIIQYNQNRGFSAIWGGSTIPVTARSVARGLLAPINAGVIILDPKSSGALSAVGNASLSVNNAVIVDSNSASGASLTGNATVTATVVDLSGTPGYSTTGNAKFGAGTTVLSNQTPIPDPLGYLPQPNPGSLPVQNGGKAVSLSGNSTATLNAGVYKGGISISGNASATLNPGIYYMQGGGFSVSGNGSVTGNGVMIFKDSGGGSISIAGNGNVTITPIASGIYKGISIFQDRSIGTGLSIVGNGLMNISGTLYSASGSLNVRGNGDNLGTQLIVYDLSITGNGSVNLNYNANTSAKTRVLGLVE